MREILQLAVALTIITAVAGTALSRVYVLTRDRIEAVERQRELDAMRLALPEATVFEPDTVDGFVYFRGYADSTNIGGQPVGYVARAAGKGYSSTILTMVGVDPDMQITGIKVASQQETPGLGTRIEEVRSGEQRAWFQRQFEGLRADQLELTRTGEGNTIESITGATISSRAVTESVRRTVRQLEDAVR